MEYELELRYPKYEVTTITSDDLPGVYAKVQGSGQPTFTWNPDGDDSVIVVAGDDYSYINLQHDDSFYVLVVSEDEEEVVIVIGDNDTTVSRKALAPRELGLEVLRRADEVAWLLTEYTWEEE